VVALGIPAVQEYDILEGEIVAAADDPVAEQA